MCYLVAGFVNKKAYTNLFIDIWQSYVPYEKYKPSFMSIKNTIEETLPLDEIVSFRFTANPHCDCGTSLGGFGGKKVTDKLNGYLSLLRKFQDCPKIRNIFIFKHFYDGSYDKAIKHKFHIEKIHISEIDENYLATIKDDVVYKILYYKKWDCTSP